MATPVPYRIFFSVSHDLVLVEAALPHDLFVNSSSLKERERFVRVFPQGEILHAEDLEELRHKYYQLYVPEDQRASYMRSLVASTNFNDQEKANVLKDSALNYLGRIFDKEREFSTELLEANIEGCREVVESMVDLLGDYSVDDLRGLIGNLSFHDFYTFDHSINVSMYSITIWRMAHPAAPRRDLVNVGLGGLLHDLGKIKVPTHILNKPDKLSDEEYAVIREHPDSGLALLMSGEVKVHPSVDVDIVARIVHEHHENWDGSGYPAKKKGVEIHPMARACTIADIFDAITTKRAYNQVLAVSEAVDVMGKARGHKLEPELFDVFANNVEHVKTDMRREMKLSDHFDPTIPWRQLPLEEIEKLKEDFGKIRFVDGKKKKG